MSDCPNAEIRDLLPEFVHGTLAGAEREGVELHVTSCADCTSEVALLRAARRSLSTAAPAVDVASIVRALPMPPVARPSVPGVLSIDEARRARSTPVRFGGWRRAAAVLLVAAGATTVAVMRSDFHGSAATPPSGTVAVTPTVDGREAPINATPDVARPAVTSAGLSLAAGVSDLSDDALVALLDDLDDLDTAPETEPAALLPDMTDEEGE